MTATDLTHYQRNLPHRLPPGEIVFVTFRLAGSLPQPVLERLRAEYDLATVRNEEDKYVRQRRYFGKFDAQLDNASAGALWLRQPEIASLVQQALHFHGERNSYLLVCYCLMANHVHLVVSLPDQCPPLIQTLKSIKSYTARLANQLLGREGQFWQRESYDHLVRDAAELERVIAYVVNNPVKAGLVEN
ncbi:MAG: transposase [Janthinobacterium lividum]